MIIRQQRGERSGATAVETALVLIPLTMFIFGIFEFGWLFMNYNLLNNAAREGCRFALANNTDTTLAADTQTVATTFMANANGNFNNFTVTVSGTHNGTAYTGNGVNNLVAGDMITVTVSGQYRYMNILPFVRLPTTVTLTSGATMVCEGAM